MTDFKSEAELLSQLKSSYQRAVEERQCSSQSVVKNLMTMVKTFLKSTKSSQVRDLTARSQFSQSLLEMMMEQKLIPYYFNENYMKHFM